MTAGIINLHNVFGGNTCGATRYNKKGMFENTAIRNNVTKKYLTFIGKDPMGQNPLPDTDELLPFDNLKKCVLDILKIQGWDGQAQWYYKGAKMCLIWPLWKKAFPNAKWVIVRRRDEDIVASCLKTAFMRKRQTTEEWQDWVDHHKRCFTEMYDNGVQIREVWPSKFIDGDLTEIKDTVEWLGLEWNESVVDEFIEPNLWSRK